MSVSVVSLIAFGLLPAQQPDHAAPTVAGPDAVPQSVQDLTERERSLIAAFSSPGKPPASPTNAWADSAPAAELGAKLFFERGLSGSGDLACTQCHDPQQGWADGKPLAEGAALGERNAPSVLNSAYGFWQFWDGRSDSLWAQALGPLENELEMGGSRVGVLRHIAENPALAGLFVKAFGPLPSVLSADDLPAHARPAPIDPQSPLAGPTEADLADPQVAAWQRFSPKDQKELNVAFSRVGKALAAYERRLVTGRAPFDVLAEGLQGGDESKLAAVPIEALHGWRLFVGKAGCVSCHFGTMFSDGRFHNLGLPLAEGEEPEEGRPAGIRHMRVDPMNGRGQFSDDSSWDANKKLLYVASSEHVIGAFKTPSLRDVARTAPYSHDGRFASLEEVIDFYSELPGEQAIGHREETLKPLRLSDAETQALIAFLHSLTGPPVEPPRF